MLNKVLLVGRLSRNPEVRFLASGMQITSFTIVVNRRYKSKNGEWQEESYFFDVEAYGNVAERVASTLSKGYQVLLEGSLRQDKWESQSGEKRSKVKIVADRVSIISKPVSKNVDSEINEESIKLDIDSENIDEDIPW
ncbi:MAG: single-stranded DNA-binding protein [Hydrogenothermaceae bacterium]|nr:single-stranded DNA-binding protein [Hydrogenothermaceae bacterium]